MERKTIVVTFLLAIFLISFVSAFGIVSPYWEGKPLQISPGDTAVVELGVQNMGTDKDVRVRAVLKQGSEIASVPEKEYLVKAETKDTLVPVTVTIPLNESLAGKEYVVTVSFKTIDSGEGGIALGIGIDTTFDVLVTGVKEEPEGRNLAQILVVLILIIAIIIILYIFRKKIFKRK